MSKEFKNRRFKKFKLIIIFVLIVFSVYTLPATRYPLSLYPLHPIRYTLDSVAYAGIQNTKHDLSVGGPGPIKATEVTEKCVFCHTPHASSGSYPLWNHKLSEETYTLPPITPSMATVSLIQPEGSSKLCLGCHDGTVAIGAVLNTPGRGSTGAIAMTQDYITDGMTGYIGGTVLTGKHLFSIEYDTGLADARLQKCIDGKTDMGIVDPVSIPYPVQLRRTAHDNGYAPDTPGAPGARLGIQCRTCHDPHEETDTTKCFLVNAVDSEGHTMNCQDCPCLPTLPHPDNNYDALCNTCHYSPCP